MADFVDAYMITLGHEGGYVNDPDDPGGETLYGISRIHWPDWDGWSLVDSIKRNGELEKIEDYNEPKLLAEAFYKAQFWDRWHGDDMSSQLVANEMFDTAVNLSVSRAVEFLQEALNLANRNGVKWADIVIDGRSGARTVTALDQALGHGEEQLIHNLVNHLQAGYYIKRMRQSSVMEKYIGWFKRTRTA